VNAVAPGLTLVNAGQDAADYTRRIAELPLRTGGTPDEVAEAVLYLAITPSVTGQTIALDGGQHLAWQTAEYR
jgi:NAD(P)-dependent dehydrogenase (short-subunit alcohol dehydrogenase family)